MRRDAVLRRLVEIQYERNDVDFSRGTFRVRGDTVEIFPAYEREKAIRVEWFGDEIETISEVDPLRGKVLRKIDEVSIFPGSHYVTPADRLTRGDDRASRTSCAGGSSSSRRATSWSRSSGCSSGRCTTSRCSSRWGAARGSRTTRATCRGARRASRRRRCSTTSPRTTCCSSTSRTRRSRRSPRCSKATASRKETLVDFGFRLPSALDNRPLRFDEWEARVGADDLRVGDAGRVRAAARRKASSSSRSSARPACSIPRSRSAPSAARSTTCSREIRERVKMGDRVLVTTLTKRMAEDLTEYYAELGVRVRYLHSDIDTLERIEILRDLRLGEFDVLVGINLLREGLDLPEVSLVAHPRRRQGGLPARRALADPDDRPRGPQRARQGDHVRRPRDRLDEEGDRRDRRRRAAQEEYNRQHGITPKTIEKAIHALEGTAQDDFVDVTKPAKKAKAERHPAGGAAPDHLGAAPRDVRPVREAGVREGGRAPRPHQGPGRDPPVDGLALASVPLAPRWTSGSRTRERGHADVEQAPDPRALGLALALAARLGVVGVLAQERPGRPRR